MFILNVFFLLFRFNLFASESGVYSFGYDDLGSGVNQTNIAHFPLFEAPESISFEKVSQNMPLFFPPGIILSNPVIFFQALDRSGNFKGVFYDIYKKLFVKSFVVENYFTESTSTYDEESRTIFTLLTEKNRKNFAIAGFSLATNKIDLLKINLNEIYSNDFSKTNIKALERILSCKSSIKIFKVLNKKILFWGCSTPIDYGKYRGVRGSLGSVELGKNNLINKESLNVFFPSVISNNELTGFNTGIYHLGGGVALTPPNSIVVYTGNGPSFSREGNYGCSILTMDASLLKPTQYLMVDDEGFHECFSNNLDFSTSSPSLAFFQGEYWGVGITSNGYLQFYRAKDLAYSRKKWPMFYVRQGNSYGQANTFVDNDSKKLQSVFVGNNVREDFVLPSQVFLNSQILRRLKNIKLKQKKRIGYILKKPIGNELKLNLYYSGKVRSHYISLIENSKFEKSLRDTKINRENLVLMDDENVFSSPYVEIATVGYSVRRDECLKNIKGKSLIPISVKQTNDTVINDVVSENEAFDGCLFSKIPTIYNGKIIHREDVEIVYEYKNEMLQESAIWSLQKLSFLNLKSSLKKTEIIKFPAIYDNPHSHIATGKFFDKYYTFVVLKKNNSSLSTLFVVDLENSKIFSSYDFEGDVHRTMPVITPEGVFISTKQSKIYHFKFRK